MDQDPPRHTDETDPLGAAPPAGFAEKAALFTAAHEALDLPEAGAEEARLSDGQLRVRARALEREEAWAPRRVGDERNAALRARAELGARGVDLDAPDEQVTAAEWLAEHRAEQQAAEAEEATRGEQLAHWAEDDRAAAEAELSAGDEMVRGGARHRPRSSPAPAASTWLPNVRRACARAGSS
jgi:hypothetical protein